MPDLIAMILLPVAVLMCGYALMVFLWRGSQIARKQVRTDGAVSLGTPATPCFSRPQRRAGSVGSTSLKYHSLLLTGIVIDR